jgi:hypothetical protein
MRAPEARAFAVQAPGIMNSGLSDEDVAAVMNWMVPAISGASLADPFAPYTAAEVAEARRTRPDDYFARRRAVILLLRARGAIRD